MTVTVTVSRTTMVASMLCAGSLLAVERHKTTPAARRLDRRDFPWKAMKATQVPVAAKGGYATCTLAEAVIACHEQYRRTAMLAVQSFRSHAEHLLRTPWTRTGNGTYTKEKRPRT